MSVRAVRKAGTWQPLAASTEPPSGFASAATTGFVAWPGYTGSLIRSYKGRYGAAESGTMGNPTIISGLQWGPDVGSVRIDATAHDITFRGCEVVGWGPELGGFHVESGAQRITFEYCTVHPATPTDNTAGSYTNSRLQYAIYSNGEYTTINRCNLYWCPNSIQVNGTGTVVTNTYVHDMTYWSAPTGPGGFTGDHLDCMQMNAGVNNVTITGNTFVLLHHDGAYLNQTSPLALFQDFSPTVAYTNVLIEDNLLAGPVGGGAWLYAGYETGKGGVAGSNVIVRDNLFWDEPFGRGGAPRSGYQMVLAAQPWGVSGNQWTNNRWYDGPNAGVVVQ
ncbi:MAG TPA: hypothetical protein VD735_02350 [Candidatus Saccharimonadales bacterium]|nr:hypothetical protein [Candidatus Saccharimonadales bacterium]